MSDAARAELPPHAAEAAPPEGARRGPRAFALLESGVHGVSMEQAVEWVRRSRVSKHEAAHCPIVWIDLPDRSEQTADFLRDRLGFHPLAIEDTIHGRQRPKVDSYGDYLFLVFYATGINTERERVALNELDIFLGRRFLVTIHSQPVPEVREVIARWRAGPSFFEDTGALIYALLDSLVDGYFPVLNHFSDRAEGVESDILSETGEQMMQRIFAIRRELVVFRRVVAPQRDVLSTMLRRDLPMVQSDLFPYLQDVHDHTLRAVEEIDALRELLAAALEAHLSAASNQLNQTMRVMTAWTIILATMTVITGIYGMNFDIMPELHVPWAYFGVLGVMLALGGGLLLFFRRLGWL
jgi:magnesium transporter